MNRYQLNRAVLRAVGLLLITGHAAAGEQVISVQHDSSHSVTRWITPQGGISCLPDSSIQHQQQATPASGDERFQL